MLARRTRANPRCRKASSTGLIATRRRGYQGSSGSGGALAGATAGGSVGRPRCARIFWIAPWSKIAASSFLGPPQ